MELISECKDLDHSKIKIKNPEALRKKIDKIAVDGKEKLHIVFDFDYTITLQKGKDGERLYGSFEIFINCPSVPKDYKKGYYDSLPNYLAVDMDVTMSVEEKTKFMVNNYNNMHKALIGYKYPEDEVKEISKKVSENIRDGVKEAFDRLNSENIPTLIFSAGAGDAIVHVLKFADLYLPNVKIISNFLDIQEDGTAKGIKGKIIHVLNKNEAELVGTSYYEDIKSRPNAILLGDNLGDANMTDGMETDQVIKIGYLNVPTEKTLQAYMDAFDIVLIEDDTVDVLKNILQKVIA